MRFTSARPQATLAACAIMSICSTFNEVEGDDVTLEQIQTKIEEGEWDPWLSRELIHFFRDMSDEDLLELKCDRSDTIAVRAAWDELRRTFPVAGDSASLAQSEPMQRFFGFIEGRLECNVPFWWEEEFSGMQVWSQDTWTFSGYDFPKDEGSSSDGRLIAVVDGSEHVLSYEDRGDLAEFVIPSDMAEGAYSIAARYHDGYVFVALPEEVPFPFAIHKLSCSDSEIVWSSHVDATASGLVYSGRPLHNIADIVVSGDSIVVFGIINVEAYIVRMNTHDGSVDFRFSTSF